MCLLFETIRIIDREPRNLVLHDRRMNHSRSKLFGKDDLLRLSDYITIPDNVKKGITKCRVIYGPDIKSIEFSTYTPASISTLKMVDACNLVYDHKYLDRSRLTDLIDRRIADDILIFRNDCITDASFANIVFTDGKCWVTPDTPLLCGTMRELLIYKGVIKSERITIDDLKKFTHFRLINAMLGFNAPSLPISNIQLGTQN